MSYHQLSMTKSGPFYVCLLAGCWPKQFSNLPKHCIVNTKLVDICDNLRFVIDETRAPNKVSLILSSYLINGLVKLYHKKVVLLITDIFNFKASVSRHMAIPQRGPDNRKNKKKRQAPKDPERVIDQNCVVNISEITLQEPSKSCNNVLYDGFGELPPHDQMLNVNDDIFGCELDTTSAPLMNVNHFPSNTIDINNAGALPVNAIYLTVAKDAHIPEILIASKTETSLVPDIVVAEKVKKRKRVAKKQVLEDIILNEVVPSTKKTRKTIKRKIREMESININCIDQKYSTTAEHVYKISEQSQCQEIVPQTDTVMVASYMNNIFNAGFTPKNIAIEKRVQYSPNKSTENLQMLAFTPQISINMNKSSLEPDQFGFNVMEINTEVVYNVQEELSIISASKIIEIHGNKQQKVVTSDIVIDDNNIAPSVDTLALNKSIEEYDDASLNRTAVMVRTPSPTGSTKENKRTLNEDWDEEGVFKKILTCRNAGITPITIETLIFHEPKEYGRNAPSQRMMAAKAFASLLRLKKRGFVEVVKKPNSLDIMDIKLTEKSCANFDYYSNK